MKLYLVKRTTDVNWEEDRAAVVCAQSSSHALELMEHIQTNGFQHGDYYCFNWPEPFSKASIRCIGIAAADIKPGLIITDNKGA